ncbi:endonuclease/exonuclease/phosphatase family protein [Haloarcula sp. S1CR25-12]|uniref:Endonuclease/exonuclease/phosphatase family protein n=1 Tax=Haloarcula saliterrae TaxID=2950534 RepID=A0ABU2FE59_9EURY|nr:endonuclease/exonuclease/phosphatase family protein [Haloarcula sp. S1CR25-12]MDS0260550.1 endonuclease/exonuclease/phosphatase family protein [Haloarcula sp. S1CR25-12]
MKLVTWNCNQAFRKKQHQLLKLEPDIAAVPECENPAEKGDWSEFTDWWWTGDNPNKGIGVFTRNGIEVTNTTEIVEADHFLHVETGIMDVLAVWTVNNKEHPRQRYISQAYTALENNPELVNENTVVAGDFNWNVMWDESPNSPLCGNLGDVQRKLNQYGLYSAYHAVSGNEFGEETEATFYMHKKEERPYHIDYAFVPRELMDSDVDLMVGEYHNWIEASDHVPLLVTF